MNASSNCVSPGDCPAGVPLPGLSSTAYPAVLSGDGLSVVYVDIKTSAEPVMSASRSNTTEPFGTPIFEAALTVLNENVLPGWISADRCRCYLAVSSGMGQYGYSIWVASRPPFGAD